MIPFDIGLDLFPMLAAVFASVSCGLLGNFLVLRRLSLMGDAISHSVLPGLVVAFLLTQARSPLVMFAGAAAAGVATVVLVELVKKLGRVEPGAAMGVVFSVLFALGVLLIEQAAVRHVDLDADCVLHGQLETLAWYGAPDTWGGLLTGDTLRAVPRQVVVLLVTCLATVGFVAVLFKELRLAAFDAGLATSQGFNATVLHYALMVFVASATVASFEAVGSILVIAMLVCPAATARLLTDRLRSQIVWSVVVAVVSGAGGYLAATAVPAAFGKDSVNAAGAISMMAGALLVLAIVASPSHGLVTRALRQRGLSRRIALDDLLAAMYRREEDSDGLPTTLDVPGQVHRRSWNRAMAHAVRRGLITADRQSLTDAGRVEAAALVRKHRLWEHYLVERVGLPADHVHDTAELLEHLHPAPADGPATDPHGRVIP
ncbi:MAG: metal ABC transporter permease [Phycisphaerales bacterium JB041]